MLVHRHCLVYILLLILLCVSCLRPQREVAMADAAARRCTQLAAEKPLIDAETQQGMSNDIDVSQNSFDYGGFVANTEREVPTGPDPLHNREEQN